MTEYAKFRDRDYEYGFYIYSHYTTILGLESGEGKTWLFDSLAERYNEGIVSIEASYPVIFADSVNLLNILKTEDRSVIFVDEISINKNSQYLGMVNSSKHFIVAITRAMPFRANSPLCGIYRIITVGNGQFSIEKINKYNDLRIADDIGMVDVVVTEAAENRSEHSYIMECKKNYNLSFEVISAGGKDKIAGILYKYTKLNKQKKLLVLMDLANVSPQYKILIKRCKDNPNIFFYPYASFEELLYKSRLVERLNKKHCFNPYDFCTLERYYENALEKVTGGSNLEYNHKQPLLNKCYTDECKNCNKKCSLECNDKLSQVLDSPVGKRLYKWIDNLQEKTTRKMDCF